MAVDYTLYLATDPALLAGRDMAAVVAEAVDAGVTAVQLRDKTASGAELYATACRLLEVTRPRAVPLIINDRVDVMLASGADGIHVGAEDLPLEQVRAMAGPDAIVGYSVNTEHDLAVAERFGADYIGVGPVFPTATKPDARAVLGVSGLHRLAARARCPVVAIGGITPANCADAVSCGAAGVCVISAILGRPDVGAAVAAFRNALAR